ncbi:hypothetical protein AB0J43_08225 [Nonomuraea fuscirosea]
MGEYREAVAHWMRHLTIVFDASLSEQEQADLIDEINGPVHFVVDLPSYRWPWQRAVAREVMDAACHGAVNELNERLNPALETTLYLLDRLSGATGRPRQDLMREMAISLDAAIAAAEDPPPTDNRGDNG